MTGQPPPDPRSSRDLGFDELVAIFVALAAIGSILFWGLTRGETGTRLVDLDVFRDRTTAERDRTIVSTAPDAEPEILADEDRTTQRSPVTQPDETLAPPARTTTDRVVPAPVPAPVPRAATPTTPVAPQAATPIVIAPPPRAAAVEFPDVPADYWAYPFITDLSRRGIIAGLEDGTFQPEQPVTRAQYAALIQGILSDPSQAPIAFSDVGADYWATPAINSAVESEFLQGYPNGTFQPDQPISRVQVLASLVNGLQLSPAGSTEAVNRFSDADQIPDWATPVTATATESGLVVNHPNVDQLNPNQPATRAEIAAIVYQALEATGQVEPIQSQYIVQP
jgi:hypothetical protein